MVFHVDLKHVCCILKRDCFPEHILNRVTNNYLNSKYVNIPTANKKGPSKVSYFKLPYMFHTENMQFGNVNHIVSNLKNIQ